MEAGAGRRDGCVGLDAVDAELINKTWGCHSRAPFLDGYMIHGISKSTGLPVSTYIPFVMSRDCNYTNSSEHSDPKCDGCSEKAKAIAAQTVSTGQVVTA